MFKQGDLVKTKRPETISIGIFYQDINEGKVINSSVSSVCVEWTKGSRAGCIFYIDKSDLVKVKTSNKKEPIPEGWE